MKRLAMLALLPALVFAVAVAGVIALISGKAVVAETAIAFLTAAVRYVFKGRLGLMK